MHPCHYLRKSSEHPFYVSVTDAHYREKSSSIQISQKIFWDDFEVVLSRIYQARVNIKKGIPAAQLSKWIADYTLRHQSWKVNGKTCDLEFVGYEVEEDVIWIFLEALNSEKPQKVEVVNSMLTDILPQQKNITHIYVDQRTLSLITDKKNTSGMIQF